jgi:hypothetical protein
LTKGLRYPIDCLHLVPAKIGDLAERQPRGVYSGLIQDFIQKTSKGDFMEVKQESGESFSGEGSRRIYQGLLQSVRYRKKKGTPVPVEVHRSAGRVYLHHI